ncbi:MAG: hypothetical protein Q9159_001286 [Coniocarpon cinnabarinum]
MTNAPDRFELFLREPGEKSVTMHSETRVPNAAIFHFHKEDHTLGNLLRAQLHKNPHTLFSGYKVPHPLFPHFELRVQTDGEVSPKEAVLGACEELVRELNSLSDTFNSEWELRRVTEMGGGGFDGA